MIGKIRFVFEVDFLFVFVCLFEDVLGGGIEVVLLKGREL